MRFAVSDRLLWSHVFGSAGHSTGHSQVRFVFSTADRLHEAEIKQLGHIMYSAATRDEDVIRVNVTVNERLRVGFAQGITNLT